MSMQRRVTLAITASLILARFSPAELRRRLVQLVHWAIAALERLVVVLEADVWHDDASTQQLSSLLQGGTLDHLEWMAPPLPPREQPLEPPERARRPDADSLPNPAAGADERLRHNTRHLRPLMPRADDTYGAHLLPKFLATSLDELKPFIDNHRSVHGWDWQLLHLAAAAGRTDVASYLCSECHLPIKLRNRKGRNVIAAAIDHRRLGFVRWVLYGDRTDFVRDNHGIDLDQVREDLINGKWSPLLSAARHLDLALLRVLIPDDLNVGMGMGWPVFMLGRERVEEAAHIAYQQPTQNRTRTRWKNAVLKILLYGMREYDIEKIFRDSRRRDQNSQVTDAQQLAAMRLALSKLRWARVSRESLPWTPPERRKLYLQLRKFVAAGRVSCAQWLLDDWGVTHQPPPECELRSDLHLADQALGCNTIDLMVKAKGATEKDERQYLVDAILRQWDGKSAMSLAVEVETVLQREEAKGSRDHNYQTIESLRSLSLLASGRVRDRGFFESGVSKYADEGPHVDMLGALTARLGMMGAPQLKFTLCTGLVWPLQWLMRQSWLRLEAPIGGVPRAPQHEGDVCPICYGSFIQPIALQCGHEFCRRCIRKYFRLQQQQAHEADREPPQGCECPYCRQPVLAPDMVATDLVTGLADDLDTLAPWLRPPALEAADADDASEWAASAMPVGNVVAALAARIGAVAVLEFVASHTPPVNLGLVLGDGSTLMHFAASERQPAIVKWLLANGCVAMAAQQDSNGRTPLHCACRSGDLLTCRVLLRQPDAYRPTAIYGSDVEGEGGWVDELLSSPHEAVRTFGREHLEAVAARNALEAVPRVIADGGPLEALADHEAALAHALEEIDRRDLHHSRDEDGTGAPLTRDNVKGQDAFAGLVEAATTAGRVDIVRWLFSAQRGFYYMYRLDMHLIPRWERDAQGERLTPKYEEFGRDVAVRCRRADEFDQLYNLLLTATSDEQTLCQESERLFQKIAVGASVAEIEATSTLVIATRAAIPDDLISEYGRSEGGGLPHLFKQRHAGRGSPHRIEGRGEFTALNQIAIHGHMHLLEWVLAMPSVVGVTEALDMFERSVRHSIVSAQSRDVQRRLIAWLDETHGHTDFSGVTPFRNRDCDDSERGRDVSRRSNLPESYHAATHSLLDSAVYQLVLTLAHKREERRDPERVWATIETLAALQPAIPCDLALLCEILCDDYSFTVRGEDADSYARYRTHCETHVLRLLQFFSARGHDLTAPVPLERKPPSLVSHLLLKAGWIDCFAWLVEQHPSIAVPNAHAFNFGEGHGAPEEWHARNRRKLAEIRRSRPAPGAGVAAL